METSINCVLNHRMKVVCSQGIVLLISIAAGGRTAAADEIEKGPIHHWKFDEKKGAIARDSVGENNISLGGYRSDDPKWVEGRIGNALHFSRDTNYGLTAAPIRSIQYTIVFWSKLIERTGTNPRILGPQELGWISADFEHNNGIGIQQTRDHIEPAINKWEHYAIVFDRPLGDVKIYKNGDLVRAGTAKVSPAEDCWMFGHNGDPENHKDSWNGMLDEVRIYDRLLSSKDLAKLYEADVARKSTDTRRDESSREGGKKRRADRQEE